MQELSRRIAVVTCAEVPQLDEDGPALCEALAQRGLHAEPAVWDDPSVDWSAYELAVVRSTWDYPQRRDAFLAWASRADAETRVRNAPAVLRVSTDKCYLRTLEQAGVPVVPTIWLDPRQTSEPPADMWCIAQELVVKPSISAGSKNTARFAPVHEKSLRELVTKLLAEGRTVMLQPYVKAVDDVGETAVIYLGDEFSHAIYKGPLLESGGGLEQGLFRQETIRRREATAAQRRIAEMALDAMPVDRSSLLYARVDLVPGPDDLPCVLEVELAEPSLFLSYHEHATERFASCIAAAVHRA
ncbi:MAG: hypothetical protein MUF54_04785 [Polyangiaceae bacterium]|jgi:glutathione synthase/RimK-type ligase-like ATP-grasp enzyme|nr:hypothetical protein [Polyangiaceae bacterium]